MLILFNEKKKQKMDSLSRVLKKLQEGNFGIISTYKVENPIEKNSTLHAALRSDIGKQGYGFIELVSFCL